MGSLVYHEVLKLEKSVSESHQEGIYIYGFVLLF